MKISCVFAVKLGGGGGHIECVYRAMNDQQGSPDTIQIHPKALDIMY